MPTLPHTEKVSSGILKLMTSPTRKLILSIGLFTSGLEQAGSVGTIGLFDVPWGQQDEDDSDFSQRTEHR